MSRSSVRDSPEGAVLTVQVQPKPARTEYMGTHGDALKFRVAAPPVEGAAGAVVVRAGLTSRRKQVLLTGVPASLVREVLPDRPARSKSKEGNRLRDTAV
ncbi:MAG: DUF167 domain-containing protein [Nitrospirae bacterium]|nr:MAG: DUF167 domain-containing protein [Nitrospirota bacterium]